MIGYGAKIAGILYKEGVEGFSPKIIATTTPVGDIARLNAAIVSLLKAGTSR